MPQEQIYQPQVAPGSTPGIPLASPQDFGSAVGQGIAELGGALEQRHFDAYRIERDLKADQERTAVSASFAATRHSNDQALEDLKTKAGPGGAGYSASVANLLEGQREALTKGIVEDGTRQAALRQFDEYAAQTSASADHYQLGTAIKKSVSDNAAADDTMRNRIATNPQSYAQEVHVRSAEIANLALLTPDQREAAIRSSQQQASMGLIQGLVDSGQVKAALELIKGGAFDDHLSPEQREWGQRYGETEVRRQEALAAHQIALQKAQTNEAIATAKAQQSAGIVVPDAQLDQLAHAATANGDTSNAVELSAMRIRNSVNRETQPWSAQQFDQNIADLRALGSKATPDQQVRLKALEEIAPQRKAQFERDPGQWAALNGSPPPALDFSDPATWAARKQWAATVGKTIGRPVPLLQPAEVDQLKANFVSGDKGRLQVIDTIAPLGGLEAMQAMKQIAPDDAIAQRLVGLPTANRASAARGAEARKADRSLIDDMKAGADPGSGRMALEKFTTDVAPALARFAPQDANAAREIAGNLYADWARAHGVHTFNPNQYGTFLQMAVGGAIDRQGVFHGGIGYWNKAPVKLPAEQSQAQFEHVLSSVTWSGDPKVTHPVYSDGKTVMTPQTLRSYTPVARSDGMYEFHGPNGVVVANNAGGVFKLDIGYLGRKYLK